MSEFLFLEYLISPSRRIFWVYILSSLLMASIFLYYNRRLMKINLCSKLWLHPSAKLDYYYFIFSYFIKILMIFPMIISAKSVAFFINKELYWYFGFNPIRFSYEVVIVLYTFCSFIVSDFTRYWLHRALHTIPFLWEFHKVHHSAKVLTLFTYYRVHPVENILFGFRYSLSIGLVTGVFIYFFGSKIGLHEVLGVNIFIFTFSLLGANLRHSHIPLGFYKGLEKYLISPRQHQIHHSKKYFNKNYGGYLAIWDSLFGTLKLSCEVKVLKFGISKNQMDDFNSIMKIIFTPFTKFSKSLR